MRAERETEKERVREERKREGERKREKPCCRPKFGAVGLSPPSLETDLGSEWTIRTFTNL